MSKVWLVALNEYKQSVLKKSFIFLLLSVPLFIGFTVGFGAFMSSQEDNNAPVGYVDHAGVFEDPVQPEVDEDEDAILFLPFPTEEDAQAALEADEIQAYYVLSPDYARNRKVDLIYIETPGENATSQFYDFLQINLLSGYPPEIAQRVTHGIDITIRAPDGSREFPKGNPTFGMVSPVFIGLAFLFLVLIGGGFMMEGVAKERENRTMEVIVTSVSPLQMVAGKILGIVGICLTQLAFWVLIGILAVFLAGQVWDMEWFQNPTLDWGGILSILAISVPSFVLTVALLFSVGATVAESQEGQGVGPILFMLSMIPTYFIIKIGEEPNGIFAIVLSMVPFASLMTMAFRNMLISVPLWQILLSAGIHTLCAIAAVWLAGRAFRFGMLRVGQRIRWGEIVRKVGLHRERTPGGMVS
jgi:ABC-2 type transport system permease protein